LGCNTIKDNISILNRFSGDFVVNTNSVYRISVDYEVPTKSIQYGNIILDSIASQFDGVATTFALKKDNNAYTPGNAQQLIVILGNDAQKPHQTEEDHQQL
jgi:hypothetical protein